MTCAVRACAVDLAKPMVIGAREQVGGHEGREDPHDQGDRELLEEIDEAFAGGAHGAWRVYLGKK